MDHQSEVKKMIATGFMLDVTNNLNPANKFNFLQNIRVYLEGCLESRPRVDSLLSFDIAENSIVHTIKTILNKANATKLRIIGVSDKLYIGAGSPITQTDSGFSGSPLQIVDFRPESAIQSYAYIGDKNKLKKVGVDGTYSSVGLLVPRNPVSAKIGAPQQKVIDECGDATVASWVQAGSAGAPTTALRINTTVLAYLADGALPNYASIVPVAFTADMQPGAIVLLNGADTVIITEVLPAALLTGVATISKIVYDSGATGLCTIVLSISSQAIKVNSILLLNGTEYVRVTQVTYDNNNIPSIKCSTVGTFAAGNSISGVASFRFYGINAYVATNTVATKYIKSVIAAAGLSSLTRTMNVDLITTSTKPLTEDSILHFSGIISNPAALIELQFQLDVDSATNDFTKNFYTYPVSPNFFTATAQQTASSLSVIQQVTQRQQLLERYYRKSNDGRMSIEDPFDPILPPVYPADPGQTTLGTGQWTEFNIRLGDFLRTGADNSRTLKDVKAIRISVNANAALDLYIDSIWVGGSLELDSTRDSNAFLAYNYVWRVRDPATKNKSNWSPPLRNGIRTNRTRIELTFPAEAVGNYSASYKLDVARFGGTLNDFRLVGSAKNDGSVFIDESSDRIIADNELAGRFELGLADAVFDFYQPFAILDAPKKGTCGVTGTDLVWSTGDTFNTTWPRGTQIYINGISNKLYTSPIDSTHISLEKDVGALTGATFEITDPLLTAQPLSILAGPFGEGVSGLVIFGAGDKNAAGTLYWLDPNSPDTMSDINKLEITSPSEPIMAIVMYDSYAFVWTTRRSFTLLPTYSYQAISTNVNARSTMFIAKENANSRGLFCRTGICSGRDFIYHLAENVDGIYKVQGSGNPICITQAAIHNLFYQNGVAPTAVTLIDGTIVNPPDFSKPDDIIFSAIKDFLMFRFVDINNKAKVLVYSEKTDDWISYDTYLNDEVGCFYSEELDNVADVLVGLKNGVGIFANSGTRENTIQSIILPFAFDGGNSRVAKLFDEEMIDSLPTADGITVKNYYDNGLTSDADVNLTGIARSQQLISINSGIGILAKNITTKFSWLIKSGVKLFEEQFWFVPKSIDIKDRASDWEDAGTPDLKLWQGITIEADTFGVNKTLQFIDDFGIVRAILIINHVGQFSKDYSFDVPFISHKVKQISADGIDWMPFAGKYFVDAEPARGKVWEGEISTETISGLIAMKSIGLAYRPFNNAASVKLLLSIDGITEEIDYSVAPANTYFKEFNYTSARKGLFIKWRIVASSEIQLFEKDCEVEIRGWNSANGFQTIKPFGGPSRITKAKI